MVVLDLRLPVGRSSPEPLGQPAVPNTWSWAQDGCHTFYDGFRATRVPERTCAGEAQGKSEV
eukprot:4667765-Pyramimonas_sp.AAC.1